MVFVIIFLLVFAYIFARVYTEVYRGIVGSDQQPDPTHAENTQQGHLPQKSNNELRFTCLNDSEIESRVYVYVRGFGNDSTVVDTIRPLAEKDPKFAGFFDFSYNIKSTLDTILSEYTEQLNTFLSEHQSDEIVLIAQSAGGVIASQHAHLLPTDRTTELHTMASPLNGYHIPSIFIPKDLQGLGHNLAAGVNPHKEAPDNVQAFHHKTITDEKLKGYCGGLKSFCSVQKIQNNNLRNSAEFFYPEHNHDTIMGHVARMVVACQN